MNDPIDPDPEAEIRDIIQQRNIFCPAIAYHFSLVLVAAFMQLGAHVLAEPYTKVLIFLWRSFSYQAKKLANIPSQDLILTSNLKGNFAVEMFHSDMPIEVRDIEDSDEEKDATGESLLPAVAEVEGGEDHGGQGHQVENQGGGAASGLQDLPGRPVGEEEEGGRDARVEEEEEGWDARVEGQEEIPLPEAHSDAANGAWGSLPPVVAGSLGVAMEYSTERASKLKCPEVSVTFTLLFPVSETIQCTMRCDLMGCTNFHLNWSCTVLNF